MHREAQAVSASKRLNCEGVNNRHKKMVLSVMFQITFENTERLLKQLQDKLTYLFKQCKNTFVHQVFFFCGVSISEIFIANN